MNHVLVVLHSVLPGREEEYEAAYAVHLREVAKRPDVLRARRGELVPGAFAPLPETEQTRVTVYDIDTDDPATWLGAESGSSGSGERASASSPAPFMDSATKRVGCFVIVDEA
jgi:hypothetical protein